LGGSPLMPHWSCVLSILVLVDFQCFYRIFWYTGVAPLRPLVSVPLTLSHQYFSHRASLQRPLSSFAHQQCHKFAITLLLLLLSLSLSHLSPGVRSHSPSHSPLHPPPSPPVILVGGLVRQHLCSWT
jgi:hypothetical protein